MEINKNDVLIAGLVEKVEYSNEIYGEIFHRCYVNIERTSGIIDTIPVNISDKLANVGDLIGKFIKVTGHYRSYNKKDGEKTKLILYVFANSVEILENPENINEANNKILTLNNNLNIDLDINKVKYRNQAEKDHIDFLKNLTKIDRRKVI